MKDNKPLLGILATPYINEKHKTSREIIYDKTLIRLLKKKNVNYTIIYYNSAKSHYDKLLNSLDGLIFPGGQIGNFYNNTFYKAYYKMQKYLMKRATAINMYYRPFPILGICNGYENMMLIAKNYNITKNNIKNTFINVRSYKNYKTVPLFSNKHGSCGINKTKKKIIHNNSLALDPKKFIPHYKIVATSYDKYNKEFIEIVKHEKYPYYGFQGHPEVYNHDLMDAFFEVVKDSFSKRIAYKTNNIKTKYTTKNIKKVKKYKNKTLKLRVLNSHFNL
jgi:gamma-glutamyl-gamma-aminobutyrate hydrolase PuuD